MYAPFSQTSPHAPLSLFPQSSSTLLPRLTLQSGYVFRLRIFHPKELHLMKEEISGAKGHVAMEMQRRADVVKRDMVDRPLLTGTLSG